MNRASADLTYSALQWDPRDECCRVCGPEGWHELQAGDAVKFPNGSVVSFDGPSQIGGGTLGKCIAALVVGVLILIAAGAMGWGKGG